MNNKKGFTLIEMLAVIILIGIVMTIAIPAVSKIIENKSKNTYSVQRKLTEKAIDTYYLRYKGEFDSYINSNCFIIDYKTLLDENILNESDVKCATDGNNAGKIKITLLEKRHIKKKDIYLHCENEKGVVISDDVIPDLSGCTTIGDSIVSEDALNPAPTITSTSSDWSSSNVTVRIDTNNTGISSSDVKRYEYYTSNDDGNTPLPNVSPSGTGSSLVVSTNGITYVWFRTIDKNDKKSKWSNRQRVLIDKVTPTTPTITASDGIASGSTHTDNFTLFISGGNNVSGNTYYYGTSSSNITTKGSSIDITSSNRGITYYVKSCRGATNVCSSTTSYRVVY